MFYIELRLTTAPADVGQALHKQKVSNITDIIIITTDLEERELLKKLPELIPSLKLIDCRNDVLLLSRGQCVIDWIDRFIDYTLLV